jgi:hypothetical protein
MKPNILMCMVFLLWDLEFYDFLNLWNKSVGSKHGQNWVLINFGKVLKCKYWNSVPILHLAYELKVMVKRMVGNQIGNLTFDHQNLRNMGQMTYELNIWYNVEMLFSRIAICF